MNQHLVNVAKMCMDPTKKYSVRHAEFIVSVLSVAIKNALNGSSDLSFISFKGMDKKSFEDFAANEENGICCQIHPFRGVLMIAVREEKYEEIKEDFIKAIGHAPNCSEEALYIGTPQDFKPSKNHLIWDLNSL